jgi:tRNA dimethylallyltransferase
MDDLGLAGGQKAQENLPMLPDFRSPLYLPALKEETKKLIVVVGPTAVGKTAVAIALAKTFQTEIISADSRQIFKELNIGTAKPSAAELEEVPHHFVNTHSIKEEYDAAQYGRDALALITTLFLKYNDLIVCGGSGLYIKAICEGFDDIPEIPQGVREELTQHYTQFGIEWLQSKMSQLDPDHFPEIDQKNPHRMIRALEVKMSTGLSISHFRKKNKLKHPFKIIKIGLELPREDLYKRIDERMDKMIKEGLFEEAEHLYPFKSVQALQTVGYQEIFGFMDRQYDREEAIRLLKRNTRRYAKRQLTWFNRDVDLQWFSPNDLEGIVGYIKSF